MKKQLLLFLSISSPFINGMEQIPNNFSQKKHIVYSPYYDITFFYIEKVHPFDSTKYSKIAHNLVTKKLLTYDDFHTPQEITDTDLKRVHTEEYLNNLYHCASAMFAKASCVLPIALMPNWVIRWRALYPMRLATGGTVEATELAIKNGWAINLSGGYHHAKTDDCDGFCVYNDAAIAAHIAITKHNIKKILVVDLDAHQGNGNEAIFGKQDTFKDKVDVFDIYGNTYKDSTTGRSYWQYPNPADRNLISRNKSWYDHPVIASDMNDIEYQGHLNDLNNAIKNTKPELIIYNAGTDIYEEDPLGKMKITNQGIINRDEYVFNLAKENNIPIIMMLSGGYTTKSAEIISNSIENIIKKVMNEKK